MTRIFDKAHGLIISDPDLKFKSVDLGELRDLKFNDGKFYMGVFRSNPKEYIELEVCLNRDWWGTEPVIKVIIDKLKDINNPQARLLSKKLTSVIERYYIHDTPTIILDLVKPIKARKEHTCDRCEAAISEGDHYIQMVYFDKKQIRLKLHPDCKNGLLRELFT